MKKETTVTLDEASVKEQEYKAKIAYLEAQVKELIAERNNKSNIAFQRGEDLRALRERAAIYLAQVDVCHISLSSHFSVLRKWVLRKIYRKQIDEYFTARANLVNLLLRGW